ncbi:unnamed protein product [Closterium sp. NIES-53]
MASIRVIAFDHEDRPIQFDTWLDDLQLATRSQWLTRDAAAHLAIRNHLPLAECAHFGQHRRAQALYDAIVARYSSPATAALGRLLLPYLFPELLAFAPVDDLVSHLRTSDVCYRTTVPAEFLDRNPPPMFITLYFIVTRLPDSLRSVRDHFLSVDPTSLTVDLLEEHLLAAETSAVAVASAAAAGVPGAEDVGAASASAKCRSGKGKGSTGGGGGSSGGSGDSGGGGSGGSGGGSGGGGGGGGGSGGSGGRGGGGTGGGSTRARRGSSGGGQRQQQQRRSETQSPQQLREWLFHRGMSGGSDSCPYVIRTGDRPGQTCGRLHTQHRCFSRLDDAWRVEFGDEVERPRWADLLRYGVVIFDLDFDVILSAMHALSASAEGDCSRCVPPDPGLAAAALGASEFVLSSTTLAEALRTFTLDTGASHCFFRDSTTLTPLPAHVPVRLADPSGCPVVAHSSTVLPCPAVPSGSLPGLHLPWFSTNLVCTDALLDAMVTTTTPGGQRVSICTCTRKGRHLATFTRRPWKSLYTLATEPTQVAASAQVSVSAQVAPPCSCRLLSHQTLLRHHRLGHPSLPRLRGMHSRLLVSSLPRSLPPLPPSPALPCLPCIEGRQCADPHSSSFPPTSAPLQTLHMDVWGPARVTEQDREYYFLLVVDDYTRSASGSSKTSLSCVCILTEVRRIGFVMEVARTSMIHVAAPHFLWPFAVRYAAHQLNLWPRVSLPETSPSLRWMGKVGNAPEFRVWSSRAFVRDTSADKLSARAIPCVFLGFVPDAPSWQFYHRTCTVSSSLRTSRVSQVDPTPGTVPGEVAVDSGAARGTASGGAEPWGDEPGGAESGGAEPGGAEPRGAASSGVPAGVSPWLSPRPERLREWLNRCACLWSRAAGACDSAARDTGAGGTAGTGVSARAGGLGGAGPSGPGGARTGGTRAARVGGAGGAGAAGDGAGVAAGVGARGAGAGAAGGTGAAGARGTTDVLGLPSSTGLPPPFLCPPPDHSQPLLQSPAPLPAPAPYTEQTSGLTERRDLESRPASPIRTGRRVPHPRPPHVPSTHTMALRPSSVPLSVPLPAPPASSLRAVPDPASDCARAASPTVSRLLATVVTDSSAKSTTASALVDEIVDFAAACRLDYATALVAKSESESASPPSVEGECALGTDVLEDRQEDFECLAAAVPRFASMLLAPDGDPDAPDIPTPRSYAEAITGTYVDEVPQSWANIVDGMWIFRVKRPPGSPPAFKARYVARGFSQRQEVDYFQTFSPSPKMTTLWVLLHVAAQRDYELHSLNFNTSFLQGSLHEEIWLRRPHGFAGSFPAGTQWSLRWPVYSLRQAPCEWHDTQRTTLAALGFIPSTADPVEILGNPTLFLHTDTSLPPFYVLVYVDDLVFATSDTEALTLVKSKLQKRHTCTDLGELRSYLGLHITRDRARCTITLTQSHMVHQVLQRFGFQLSSPQPTPLSTSHSLSAPPSDESVEPSGSYPELVGCLIYLVTCTRPDLAYPLSLLARYVAPGRHRKVHWDAAKRVLRYLCSTSCMGLVLGGRGPVVLTGHADASWVDDSATQRSSQGYTFSLSSGSVSWRSTCSSSVVISSCEAEIYAGAMAAQELRWLTYLLTDLGEQPRVPPVLYVDNKAMIALCQEHRLEHRTKNIALRYFLDRELQ